jgi:hypothetical protein
LAIVMEAQYRIQIRRTAPINTSVGSPRGGRNGCQPSQVYWRLNVGSSFVTRNTWSLPKRSTYGQFPWAIVVGLTYVRPQRGSTVVGSNTRKWENERKSGGSPASQEAVPEVILWGFTPPRAVIHRSALQAGNSRLSSWSLPSALAWGNPLCSSWWHSSQVVIEKDLTSAWLTPFRA